VTLALRSRAASEYFIELGSSCSNRLAGPQPVVASTAMAVIPAGHDRPRVLRLRRHLAPGGLGGSLPCSEDISARSRRRAPRRSPGIMCLLVADLGHGR